MSKITLRDIAEELNISQNTVSKALRDTDGVSDSLKRRIVDTADKLGYKKFKKYESYKNVLILCREGRFKEISFWPNIILGMQEYAKVIDIKLHIMTISAQEENEIAISETIKNEVYDGIIIVGTFSDEYLKSCKKKEIPMVIIDHYSNDIECDYINSDNYHGVYQSVEYLVKMGHKKLGYIGNLMWAQSFRDRYYSFLKCLDHFELEKYSKYHWTDIEIEENTVLINKKITPKDDFPTGWICVNDIVALNFIRELLKNGVNVPDDVSVIGFDNIDISELSYPSLTTVNVPKYHMGVYAIEELIRRIDKLNTPYRNIVLRTDLRIRDSVAVLA